MQRLLLLLCLTTVHSDHKVRTNQSDVIITYEGHVEAIHPVPKRTTANSGQLVPERTAGTAFVTTTESEWLEDVTTRMEELQTTTQPEEATFEYPGDDDEVLFVPHEREVERVEDEFYRTPMRISEIMEKKAMVDVMKKAETAPKAQTTEPQANPDILFITGKNAEKEELLETKIRQSERHMEMDFRRSGSEEKIVKKKLDCTNLNCNNNLQAVCGSKKENGRYKYRLFLNDCFFRKVNCAFSYPENRYKEVPQIRCNTVAIHLKARPTTTPTIPVPFGNLTQWKSYSSRRTMNQEANGRFCSHPCPPSCPEDYDPECAISKSGKRRVFINHCKLDYDSCFYGDVWQRRPLSECVGNQKADMQQNRRFIAWMQRVGMVDKKGRLTL